MAFPDQLPVNSPNLYIAENPDADGYQINSGSIVPEQLHESIADVYLLPGPFVIEYTIEILEETYGT